MDYKEKFISLLNDESLPIEQRKKLEEIFNACKENEDDKDERIRKQILNYFMAQKVNESQPVLDSWLAWLEKQQSVKEIVERCKNSWYNEGKIAGMAEGLTDDEKYQQGWHDAIEKQEKLPEGCVRKQVAEAKEALFDNEDERIRKALISILKRLFEKDTTIFDISVEQIIAWLEKQGEKNSDKIVEKARKEKQRVLLTETDGSANIDWDCRSLDDVKILLKCGLEFIRTIEANKQILTDSRFGGCSFRVPTRYDKEIKQGEQKPAWSEEDENISVAIENHLIEYYVEKRGYPYVANKTSQEMKEFRWLKSIKQRIGG